MASRGRRLCILIMALVGSVLAAPTASMADATSTGTRRHHLAPAPAPALSSSSAAPPPVARPRAHAGHSPVQSEGPDTSAPSSPRDEATIPPSSVATPPSTASSSTGTVIVPQIAHSSAAAPAAFSAWGAVFLSTAGLVALVLR